MEAVRTSIGDYMRVLWPHNFNTSTLNSGVFMFNAAERLRAIGVDVQVEYLGMLRSPWNLSKAQRRIKRMAKEFDLVHAQYGSACSLVTARVEGCPKVVTLRGSDWNMHSATFGFQYCHTRLAKLMTRMAIETYDLVITVSARMASDVSKRFPKINVATLPSPIDLDRFVVVNKKEARQALGFADNKEKWILFTSLNCDNYVKRYTLAKKAVDLANHKLGNIRMRVASGIPHSDMPLFVASCDIILCTSSSEGWPNSIKEALACNIPFISTDVSDLKDIANKEPLCRVCPADADALAENICEVLESSQRCDLRKYVVSMSPENTSKKMLELYRSIV